MKELDNFRQFLTERLAGESGSDKKFPSDWTDDERIIELGMFISEIKDLTQTLEKWKSDSNKDFWVKDIDKKLTYESPYKVPNAIFGRLNKITYKDDLKKLLDKASISWTKSESDFGKYDDTKTNLVRLLDGLEKELKQLKAQKSSDARKPEKSDLTIYDTWKEHNDITLDKIINNERI